MTPLETLRGAGWMPAAELAERLSVATGTIYRWHREHSLPSERLGRLLLLRPADLVEARLVPRVVGETLGGGS